MNPENISIVGTKALQTLKALLVAPETMAYFLE